MSIEAVTWALRVPVGGNAKVVLIGIANHAHPDGTESYPDIGTLAEYAHCSPDTARRAKQKLLDEGWVIEDGYGPRGQTKFRLPMQGSQNATLAEPAPSPRKSNAEGLATVRAEPSIEPSRTTQGGARAREAAQSVPADFPEVLRPHARLVMTVLRSVAEQHGAKAVTALAVGNVLMAPQRRHRPFVAEAYNFASWAANPPRPIRDAVASYRSWIDRCGDLAAVEHLEAGTPAQAANVTSIHGRRDPEAERRARQERRMRQAMDVPQHDNLLGAGS